MISIVLLATFLVAPFVLIWAWPRLLRRLLPDRRIDALIAANAARPRAGMAAVDWGKVDRAGGRAWDTALRAQGRWPSYQAPTKASAKRPSERVN